MKDHRILLTACRAALVASALGLGACNLEQANGSPSAKSAATATSPYAAIANGKVDVEGGIIEVAARRFGVVSQVLAQEGDIVKKGQILARQEDKDALLAIDSAKAALAQSQSQLTLNEISLKTAQREFDRLSRLAPSHAIPQQQLDQAGDAIATARAQFDAQLTAIQTARAQLAQAEYNEELTNIRAPMDGKIIRRYANPGSGASTLNVTSMFDLEPAIPHIVRAEITESAVPDVSVGQAAEISSEADPAKVSAGRVLRIAATFGARKNKSDLGNEASDERVVEVVVSAAGTPFLIGQQVMVKFMKPGQTAGKSAGKAAPPAP
jgi:HlyD family secretion protein